MRNKVLYNLSEFTDQVDRHKIKNLFVRVITDLNVGSPRLFVQYGPLGILGGVEVYENNSSKNLNLEDLYDLYPKLGSTSINNSGILIPEFLTILMFTKEYEDRMDLSALSPDGDLSKEMKKEWINYINHINGFSIFKKYTALLGYAKTKKQVGLGKKEIEKYSNTLVPIYILVDFLKLKTLTPHDKLLVEMYAEANKRIESKLVSIFGDKLKSERGVYYMGGKVYGNDASVESSTSYVQKMVLLSEGYNSAQECMDSVVKEVIGCL